MEKFIGCLVSLDCGETLGTYQGQVIAISPVEGSITIVQPYRNGIPFKSAQVTLRSQDIENLAIVKSSDEAKELPRTVNRMLLSNKLSSHSTDGIKTSAAKSQSSSVVHALSSYVAPHDESNGNGAFLISKPAAGMTGTFLNDFHRDSAMDSFVDCLGKNRMNGGSRTATQNSSDAQDNNLPLPLASANLGHLYVTAADNKMSARKRTSSASEARSVQQNLRVITPRKADRQQQKNHDCFNDSEISVDDFDFEKNLALFDKQAVFEEIEKERENSVFVQNSRANRNEQKYRCDENVLQGTKATYQQIKLLNGCAKKDATSKTYTTDSGLIVPSIPLELRKRLLSLAKNYGFSHDRMVEMMGRSASEMILQLLGGNSRFDPRNSHQRPHVVVICGTGLQTAVAINCARHLATRSVAVLLFLSPSFHLSKEAEAELQLYQLTGGKFTSVIDELPSTSVDLIVSALFPHDASDSSGDSWSQAVSHWANQSKARVLAIDPSVEGSSIESSWCLTWVLPLSYDDRCGQVYLCDLGIPQKIFKEVGIVFESPFAHKFVIPLHCS